MGGLFGGGGSSTPTYIPTPTAVQAKSTSSVDANKAVADAEEKIQKQLAASSNTSKNIATSALGVQNSAQINNKQLLGE